MRIIAGSARGRPLRSPKGTSIRPTADRVRQAIFDVLGQVFSGERVLDLYAGTGAMALEALSRGAGFAVLVDQAREAVELCQANAQALGFGEASEIRRERAADAVPRLAERGDRFDLVLADPPYSDQALADVLGLLAGSAVLAPGARVVVEHGRREKAAERSGPLAWVQSKRFGDTMASFYQAGAGDEGPGTRD